ncbi:MAG: hypothetical protein LBB72_02515 [Spirochaetaceae bacterium]|jgi:hypothetical protein|nr:hypothetical protein [Spirochaetaceae bacterium]
MNEKNETEGKATDETPGNDCLKESSGLAGSGHIPFCNTSSLGIMGGGRNVSLSVSEKGGNVTSYALTSNIGGGAGKAGVIFPQRFPDVPFRQ